jgi:hypothetical protein
MTFPKILLEGAGRAEAFLPFLYRAVQKSYEAIELDHALRSIAMQATDKVTISYVLIDLLGGIGASKVLDMSNILVSKKGLEDLHHCIRIDTLRRWLSVRDGSSDTWIWIRAIRSRQPEGWINRPAARYVQNKRLGSIWMISVKARSKWRSYGMRVFRLAPTARIGVQEWMSAYQSHVPKR